jgi:diacylglycerol kinase (ATP)
LVCGGDGTVGWVMNCLDELSFSPSPPVCVLPLGTGNDLAQTFKWGPRYEGENLSLILKDIENGVLSKLDRWKVCIIPKTVTNQKNTFTKSIIMNNYLSIGVDAQVALGFHRLRKENPELCASVWLNKFWYATYGVKALFTGVDNLENIIVLHVDGHVTKLPEGTEGVIILNLPSYAGGVNIWGEHSEDKFRPQSVEDKILEIAVVTGVYHLGKIQVNLSTAIRLAQGRTVKLVVKAPAKVPMQIDGEPLLQESCEIVVKHHNQAVILKKNTLSSS